MTLAILLLQSVLHSRASAEIDDHIRGQHSTRSMFQVRPSDSLQPGLFSQPVDHFASRTDGLFGRTFQQRYWVNSQYAKSADAPVLYHICGEGNATDGYFLNDNAVVWAQALGARIVYLEHRYYGESQPMQDWSTANMQFLTLDNVLEDLATFQKSISASQGWTGQWISIGGSYSGTLSALYRQKHPELVVGALASSAPMISGLGDEVGTQDDVSSLSSTSISSDQSDRQWVFQACRDFGFWEAQGPQAGARLMRPSAWLCQQLFAATPIVDSSRYNRLYDAPFLSSDATSPSHILFTYGSYDVWTALGLTQQTVANPKISVLLINGSGHHYDLNAPSSSDSSDVIVARQKFLELAQSWLKHLDY
jgi:pimeloyl-ACP methyl ester carboxylesterase